MSVYFLGDPHLGDKNCPKWRHFVSDVSVNTRLIVNSWNSLITKRDIVYVMGDVASDKEHLAIFGTLPGRKILIRGNHDDIFTAQELLVYFEEIHSMLKYKGMWLTHCPMHPQELFGKVNLHGHVHNNTVMCNGKRDDRYINACIEQVWADRLKIFLTLDEAKEMAESCPMVIKHKAENDARRREKFIGTTCISSLFPAAEAA